MALLTIWICCHLHWLGTDSRVKCERSNYIQLMVISNYMLTGRDDDHFLKTLPVNARLYVILITLILQCSNHQDEEVISDERCCFLEQQRD